MSPTPTAEAGHSRRWWILAVLCTSLMLIIVGNTSLNVAIPTISRDLNASTSQLLDPATRGFITYDDVRSIRDKGRLVKELGLRGAMFWELGADRNGVLRRALAAELPH